MSIVPRLRNPAVDLPLAAEPGRAQLCAAAGRPSMGGQEGSGGQAVKGGQGKKRKRKKAETLVAQIEVQVPAVSS